MLSLSIHPRLTEQPLPGFAPPPAQVRTPIASHRRVRVGSTGRAELERLVAKLEQVDATVFETSAGGPGLFWDLLLSGDRENAEDVVLLWEDAQGELLGFNLLTVDAFTLGGQQVDVCRSLASFRPTAMGNGVTVRETAKEVFRRHVRRPWRRTFYLTFFASPAAYAMIASRFPGASLAGLQAQSASQTLLQAFMDRYGKKNLSTQPGVFLSAGDRPAVQGPCRRSTHADDFRRANPNHTEGVGLGVCMELTLSALARCAWQLLRRGR